MLLGVVRVVVGAAYLTFVTYLAAWCIVQATVIVLAGLLMLPGIALDLGFFRPVARLLDNARAVQTVTILSLVLVVMGFHFDLLAS